MTNTLNQSISDLPRIIFGTASLGNLFVELEYGVKREIISECFNRSTGKVVFDSAGKYGAGLALESIGKALTELNIDPERVVINNKLGWYRTELKTPEPTFEKGVWIGLKNDAVQMISYDGMMKCFEQGNQLLNGWASEMVSVHDPDEYLAAAVSTEDEARRYNDILEAYRALADLKASGKAKSVGIGAKDWRTIIRIAKDVKLDWIMIANSMTIKSHPAELLEFIADMDKKGVPIINSAVFHSGFLIGGNHYDYKLVDENFPGSSDLLKWREDFFATCKEFEVTPAQACVAYALNIPGVKSVALSTTNPLRVKDNINMAHTVIPKDFWAKMVERGLLDSPFN
ncbi:aldo/keto reductase [Mucilaginibacter calamicampi]|uniref:Aldo/keto reductase n=1 Tax=Mucilaginibacter calamicampi TaxID=1302352 RepID=A0ABW2YWK0_9SPHI